MDLDQGPRWCVNEPQDRASGPAGAEVRTGRGMARKKAGPIPQKAKATLAALEEAAKQARKIARMYKTPIYVERNGRVVALKP